MLCIDLFCFSHDHLLSNKSKYLKPYLSLFCFLDGNWRVWMMWKDIIFIPSWKLFSSELWRHFSCSLWRLRSFSFLSLCVCGLFLLSENLKSFLFLPILKCHNGMPWCGCISCFRHSVKYIILVICPLILGSFILLSTYPHCFLSGTYIWITCTVSVVPFFYYSFFNTF